MLEKVLDWDRTTFIYLNNLGIDDYDIFWTTITDFRTWIPLFILFIILIFVKYPVREAILVLLTIGLMIFFVNTSTDLTKDYVARIRPNNSGDLQTLIRILQSPITYSFYSGHAASSFSLTTIFVLFLRKRFKWAWVFYAWPIIFALSRIFIGVHYPIDVIVGTVVGILSAITFYKIYAIFIVPYKKLSHP